MGGGVCKARSFDVEQGVRGDYLLKSSPCLSSHAGGCKKGPSSVYQEYI